LHIHGPFEEKGDQDEEIEGRVDLETAPDEESARGETTGIPYFVEYESRNQETTEHEEEIHTKPAEFSQDAARRMVPEKHQQHGDTA